MTDQYCDAEDSVEPDNVAVSGRVSSQPSNDRRKLFRRLAALAGLGITGVLLSQPQIELLPAVHAATMTIDAVNTGGGKTELDSSGSPAFKGVSTSGFGIGVYGSSSSFIGVYGYSSSGTGVEAFSSSGAGVYGYSSSGTGVEGFSPSGTGVEGFSSSGTGVFAQSFGASAVPLVAQGHSGQTANLQEWRNSSGTALSAVDANGRLGIGTTTPSNELDVVAATGTDPLRINTSGASRTGFLVDATAGQQALLSFLDGGLEKFQFGKQTDNTFFFYDNASAGYPLYVNPGTKKIAIGFLANYQIGIGTSSPSHLIQLSGGAYSDGSTWNNASSVRWKDNIEPLTDGVETLKKLHPVAYNYKRAPSKTTMGFIAEEIGKVLPSVVDWDTVEEGYAEGYDHVAILALAVQAVKELATRNNKHETTIQQLLERIAALEQKMN